MRYTARGTNQGTQLKVGGSSGFEAKLLGGYGRNGPTNADFYAADHRRLLFLDLDAEMGSGANTRWRRHVDSATAVSLPIRQSPGRAFAISVRCLMDSP